jgi:hypothetical protein
MQMGMYTMVFGKMIKHMVMVSMLIRMVQDMRDTGKKINNMVKVLKHGQMVLAMKGIT